MGRPRFPPYAKWLLMLKLKAVLNLLVWGNTTLNNCYEFVKLIEGYQFGQEDKLLSFDVKSLFTRVPVQESLDIVEKRLNEMRLLMEDPIKEIMTMSMMAIMKLLKLTLENCYFVWDGVLYKQASSLPIGGRLSPILANIFMEQLEF